MVGDFEVKGGGDIHYRERPAGVARTRRAQRDQVIAAHQVGGVLKLFDGIVPDDVASSGICEGHGRPLRAGRKENTRCYTEVSGIERGRL